jgi:hypothetical protein
MKGPSAHSSPSVPPEMVLSLPDSPSAHARGSSAEPKSPDECTHMRLIDDVLNRAGKRTGKVRCLECGAAFEDPYQGLK